MTLMNGHAIEPSTPEPAPAAEPPKVVPGDPDAKVSFTRRMLEQQMADSRARRANFLNAVHREEGIQGFIAGALMQLDEAERQLLDKQNAEAADAIAKALFGDADNDPLGR